MRRELRRMPDFSKPNRRFGKEGARVADSNRLHSINTSRILRAIWLNSGVSRIKVAEMLDLDRSTVTKIMQVILDRGLVVTAGKNHRAVPA